MIDRETVLKGLQIERECVSRNCNRDCEKCDLVQDRDYLLSVYDGAIAMLKEQDEIIERNKADFKTIEDNLKSALAYERKLNQQILGRLDVYQGIVRMILKMLIEEVKERKSE